MPYVIEETDGKYCVHKQNEDGSAGAIVPGGCHPTYAEARQHQKALYVNVPDARKGANSANVSTLSTGASTNGTSTNATSADLTVEPSTNDFFSTTWPSGFAPVKLYFTEGDETPDHRVIDPNATNFDRQPPLPLKLQLTQPESGGHAGAELCGVADNVSRDGLTVCLEGRLDLSLPAGRQAAELMYRRTLQTWSPDMGNAVIDKEINVTDEDTSNPEDFLAHYVKCTLLGGTIVAIPAMSSAVAELCADDGSVLVPAPSRTVIPTEPLGVSTDPEERKIIVDRTDHNNLSEEELAAIEAAFAAEEIDYDEWAARIFKTAARKKYAKAGVAMPDGSYPIPDGDALRRAVQSVGRAAPAKRPAVRAHIRKRARALGLPVPDGAKEPSSKKVAASAISACAGPANPPAEWFENPNLDELSQFITITDDGHVFGHLCGWETCHIGYQNACVEPPRDDDFSYFRHAQVRTAEGTLVATGPIALNSGHAPLSFSADRAQAHYDNPDTGIMDVAVGSDEHGIWFSGALRPDITPSQIRRLRASGVSGDWREIDGKLRLVGICSVNVPGFPKVRLTASGEPDENPQPIALVGMGIAPENMRCESCEEYTVEDEMSDLREEIGELREMIASLLDGELTNVHIDTPTVNWDELEQRLGDPFDTLAARLD